MVEDLCELGDVLHGLTVLADEGCDTDGGGQSEVSRCVFVGAELLEEGEEVGGVDWGVGVVLWGFLVREPPAFRCGRIIRSVDASLERTRREECSLKIESIQARGIEDFFS